MDNEAGGSRFLWNAAVYRTNAFQKTITLIMFPSDINVLISDSDERSLQIKIDRVVAELETWFNRNDLVINAGKTVVMSFHKKQTHFPIKPLVTFNKITMDHTAEMTFLGIQIMDTLQRHPHIQ